MRLHRGIRGLVPAVFQRQVDEPGRAGGEPVVAREGPRRGAAADAVAQFPGRCRVEARPSAAGVRAQVGALREHDRAALPGVLQLEVDDAGHGVGAVLRAGAVAQHLDLADGDGRYPRYVRALRALRESAAQPGERRRAMAPPAVDQHEQVIGRQVPQRHRAVQHHAVGDRLARYVERRRENSQQIRHAGARLRGQQVVGREDVDRDGGFGDRALFHPAAGADDDDLLAERVVECEPHAQVRLLGEGDVDRHVGPREPRHGHGEPPAAGAQRAEGEAAGAVGGGDEPRPVRRGGLDERAGQGESLLVDHGAADPGRDQRLQGDGEPGRDAGGDVDPGDLFGVAVAGERHAVGAGDQRGQPVAALRAGAAGLDVAGRRDDLDGDARQRVAEGVGDASRDGACRLRRDGVRGCECEEQGRGGGFADGGAGQHRGSPPGIGRNVETREYREACSARRACRGTSGAYAVLDVSGGIDGPDRRGSGGG